MRRTTAASLVAFLVGIPMATIHSAPAFTTGTGPVLMGSGFEQYINLGLQGVGRISASQLDAFGDTFGSVSGLQVTNWKATGTGYTGSFLTLPDRGYNSGAVYSDYRARIQQIDFSFTPYTGATPLAFGSSQFSFQYMGGALISEVGGSANTTGALPTSSSPLPVGAQQSGIVPRTANGKIAVDAEGLALFKDGAGYVTDEYGPNIYYVNGGKIEAVINPPASAMPRDGSGALTFTINGTSAADPTTGRRSNQGMEGVAISPDGKTLFTMLQSATMQDSHSGSQNRQFTRLYKYDVSVSRSQPVLLAEYVVELPRFNDTRTDQTGILPNKVGAQSEIVALDGDRLMILSRDGNGNGIQSSAPPVFKSVLLVDLNNGSPTNLASMDTSAGFSVKAGTVSSPVVSGTATLTDTTVKLADGITPVTPVQFLSLIDQNNLGKFGLNTNDGTSAAPRSAATLSEKWEGMALVSALDPEKPNDYFLFVANDNDFLTTNLKMKATTGQTVTSAGSLGASVENDTMFLAYRVTLPAGAGDQSLLKLASAGDSTSLAAFGVVDAGGSLNSGSSPYSISATTLLLSNSGAVTRPLDVGVDGGALNLLGNQVVLSGSISGQGALSVFGTSGGSALLLEGSNTFSGGLEVNGVRVRATRPENLGTGQVNLNAGGILALSGSGTYSLTSGFYVGGGTFEVGAGSLVVWSGSLIGNGTLTKAGKGSFQLAGNPAAFSGPLKVSAGTLVVGTGAPVTSVPSGGIELQSGARLELWMGGTVDLRSRVSAAPDASIYWKGTDSSSVLQLSTTVPLIYNVGSGRVSLGVTNKTLVYANGHYYQPLAPGLPVGTPVYMDAEGSLLNATQRSLGYREVAYKKLFFGALGFSGAKVSADADGNTIYDYGTQSTSTNLVGYWTKKNLPVILGPDGEGYITDGHHTTAGYLESAGAAVLPGINHLVLGTVVQSPSSQTSVGSAFWQDLAGSNAAYLYGPNGNQLALPGEAQGTVAYEGLQPLVPGVANPMPTTPGTTTMANDLYRSLTWAMADAVVKTASNVNGTKLAGFSKVDPFSPTGADVNFVEFFWGDFLRERVVWNDNAAVTSANLINAPVSFFAAAANGIALAKSELYRDQFGRDLFDYTGESFSANTRRWADASLKNGQASAGDSYNLFLGDDVSIKGDIIPSGVEGVTNNLYINAGSLLTVSGALQNFASIAINTGASLLIDWKDSAVNGLAQNKVLSIPRGTANVVFSGDNDYSKLASLSLGAGTLTIDTSSQSSEATLWADITGLGSLRKTGSERLVLSGANSFQGGVVLEAGELVLGSASQLSNGVLTASPVGTGSLLALGGSTLVFDESVRLFNPVGFVDGPVSGSPNQIHLGNHSVDFAGRVQATTSLELSGTPEAVVAFSGSGAFLGEVTVQAVTLRFSPELQQAPPSVKLQAGGGIQALGDIDLPSAISVEDEGRFDAGESLLTLSGNISGNGRVLLSGSPFGTVRLGGLNTYSGGTTVDNVRAEIAVNAADESTDGLSGAGRALGSGEVTFKNASLGFAVSASIPNTLRVGGMLKVDVGDNVGELSGLIADDFDGGGSLHISGSRAGALFLSGAGNAFSGTTVVEETTLRLLSTADSLVLGSGTQDSGAPLAVMLDAATLQIVPDHREVAQDPSTPVTARDLVLSDRGATLDVTDSKVVWTGGISGGSLSLGTGTLYVVGNAGGELELAGENRYAGGTEVDGGVLLKVSSDRNLGEAGTRLALRNGGVFYKGTGDLTFSRPLLVHGNGLVDVGSRVVTVGAELTGNGVLQVGRTAYEGSDFATTTGTLVVGDAAQNFAGRLVLGGGSLFVSSRDALKNSTLEGSPGVGTIGFGTTSVNLGGLSGDMPLGFAAAGTLAVGFNNASTRYGGILSGESLSLQKVGGGNLALGNTNTYGGITKVQEGTLTIDLGADVGGGSIVLEEKATLVINGTGRDLSAKFASVDSKALVVFNGSSPDALLKLPANFPGRALNLGLGSIQIGTATASGSDTIGAGASVSLTSIQSPVTLSGGSLGGSLNLASDAPIVLGGTASVRSRSALDRVEITKGTEVTLTAGFPSSSSAGGVKTRSFEGTFVAEGLLNVAPLSAALPLELPRLKGSGQLAVSSGTAILTDSPEFTGTTSLASGASAVLTGSLGMGGTVEVASGSKLSVVLDASAQQVPVPTLSGSGTVELAAGRVLLSGANSGFTGSLTVSKGVDVTIRGDLPAGTIRLSDPAVPLKVDSSLGDVTLPGTVSGAGALNLVGSGTFTMASGAAIGTAQLRVGSSASEKPVLDVSNLAGGVLTLSSGQALSGGGTITGSVVTAGVFAPGNSPGDFTVAAKVSNGTVTGGNLTVGSGGRVSIEYGKFAGAASVTSDTVTVGGVLTLDPSVRIEFSKFVDSGSWSSFVTPTSLALASVFKASSILSSATGLALSPAELEGMVYLEGAPLLSRVSATSLPSSGTLSFTIEKLSYGTFVRSSALEPLANYLFSASQASPDTALASFLSVVDASASVSALTSNIAALQSPVFAEAQRLSLRRTAAVSESVQGRLVRDGGANQDGWAAWSESYGWSFKRDASAYSGGWQGRNFGEIVGVQKTQGGLTVGMFGATGYASASFSYPSNALKGESFHGGLYTHLEGASHFLDASFLAGSAEQTSTRSVYLGGLSGQGRARFNTSEFAGHVRAGLVVPVVEVGMTLKPSIAVLANGYSQGAASESGLSGVGVATEKTSDTAWQTRLGLEAMKAVSVQGKALDLLASLYWVRDASRSARTVATRFNGSGAPAYMAEGDSVGANAFEAGIGASLTITPRTSARLNGVWQVRENSSQPGVNLGITVRF